MNWLARLKSERTTDTHATKATETPHGDAMGVFVGSAAYPPAPFHKIEGNESDATTNYAANDAAMPDPDRCCWPYSAAMNSTELETCAARLVRFTDKGESLEVAERVADRLLVRDREGDDRRMCLECAHLHGGTGHWRCGNWKLAEIGGSALQRDLVRMLQRCSGFNLR